MNVDVNGWSRIHWLGQKAMQDEPSRVVTLTIGYDMLVILYE